MHIALRISSQDEDGREISRGIKKTALHQASVPALVSALLCSLCPILLLLRFDFVDSETGNRVFTGPQLVGEAKGKQ